MSTEANSKGPANQSSRTTRRAVRTPKAPVSLAIQITSALSASPSTPQRGRPKKATDAQVATLSEAIARGLTYREACALADYDYEYFDKHWQDLGYLCRAIKKASALRKLYRIEAIEAGLSGWQGSAWMLERTDPAFRRASDVPVSSGAEPRLDVDKAKADLLQLQQSLFTQGTTERSSGPQDPPSDAPASAGPGAAPLAGGAGEDPLRHTGPLQQEDPLQ